MRVRVKCQFGWQRRVFSTLLKRMFEVTLLEGKKLDFSLQADFLVEVVRQDGLHWEGEFVRACRANGIEIWVE